MKHFKIGMAVLAALVTMSFTIIGRTGMIAGEYSVENVPCFKIVTVSSTNYDADNGDQLPDQTSAGIYTVAVTTADVDLDNTAITLLASSVTCCATATVRVATCTNENVTSTCCYIVNGSGRIISATTGNPASYF